MPGLARGGRASCSVGATTWVKVIVPNRSRAVRQASSAAGTAAASIPWRGSRPRPRNARGSPAGGGPLARDDRHAAASWRRRPGSAPRRRSRTSGVGDAQGEDRGDGRVGRRCPPALRISSPACARPRARRPPRRPRGPTPASPVRGLRRRLDGRSRGCARVLSRAGGAARKPDQPSARTTNPDAAMSSSAPSGSGQPGMILQNEMQTVLILGGRRSRVQVGWIRRPCEAGHSLDRAAAPPSRHGRPYLPDGQGLR